ncbi:MAG: SpoIIE family protein phosphatase [Planctomycetes bacterium]|nr:SpoIIE family protein phosphatase [Planctomycetota bacterium]
MAVLRAIKGLQPGQIVPLEEGRTVLGRHPECDVVLEVGAVSRQHARIVVIDGKFYVEDLHSRNGTFLNGEEVTQQHLLAENDHLKICDLEFAFHHQLPTASVTNDDATVTRVLEPTAMMVDDERPSTGSTIMSKIDVSSADLRLAANAEVKLKALIEIGQSLGNALGLSQVLPKLLDCLFTIFLQADRGFVVLAEPNSGKLIPKAVKYRREESGQVMRISRTIVNNVMETKQATLSADATSDARFDMAESIVDFHIRSMMCAPLIDSAGNALGVIQIDTVNARNRFNEEDLEVLASVACQAAYAVENARLHEAALKDQSMARDLKLAHQVQRGFLPDRAPSIDRYEFFDFYEPANQVGGDYYDYVLLPDGKLGILVADVAGKGVSAALLMAKLSAQTRYCLVTEPTPAAALNRLNALFAESGFEDRFVTLVLAVLDPIRHEVTLANAGHMLPLLRSNSGVVREIADEITYVPLGVDFDAQYQQTTVSLLPGESLTFYTDGVTDAMNATDELYGSQRLLGQLTSPVEGVSNLGRRILDNVRQFVGARSQNDDMCLMCFGRTTAA